MFDGKYVRPGLVFFRDGDDAGDEAYDMETYVVKG